MEIKTNRLMLMPLGMKYLTSVHEYSSDELRKEYLYELNIE